MTWFKVDDGFCFHPKAAAAGNAALGLWVRAGSWSAQQLTDGFVPRHMLSALGGRPRDAHSLVHVGLWISTTGGWEFHDWSEFQPTREQVSEQRKQNADRIRKWREQKASNGVSNGVTDTVTNAVSNAAPDPTRPDPTNKEIHEPTTSSRERGARATATRVPDPFPLTDELKAWARVEAPNVGMAEHERFMDYWRGVPGQKGRKVDWPATWRNWMRRAADEGHRGQATSRPNSAENRMAKAKEVADRLAAKYAERPAIESGLAEVVTLPSFGSVS